MAWIRGKGKGTASLGRGRGSGAPRGLIARRVGYHLPVRRAWVTFGVVVAGGLAASLWLSPGSPSRTPVRPPRTAAAPSGGHLAVEPPPGGAADPPPLRADRARQALVAELPAAGPVAALVRDAMARDGDSDPRLLGLFAAVGLRPTALAGAAGAVDPWLAAGLVDLERQVVDRCPECGWDLEDAAAGLVAEVSDPALACLVEGVATRDPAACDGPR